MEVGMQPREHSDREIDLAEFHHLLRGVERRVGRDDPDTRRQFRRNRFDCSICLSRTLAWGRFGAASKFCAEFIAPAPDCLLSHDHAVLEE